MPGVTVENGAATVEALEKLSKVRANLLFKENSTLFELLLHFGQCFGAGAGVFAGAGAVTLAWLRFRFRLQLKF